KHDDDHHHAPAGGAAGRFKQHKDSHGPHGDVGGGRAAHAEDDGLVVDDDVKADGYGGCRQNHVDGQEKGVAKPRMVARGSGQEHENENEHQVNDPLQQGVEHHV